LDGGQWSLLRACSHRWYACSGLPRPPERRGLGIAARLGFSFAAVSFLAIVANLVAESGTSIVTTTTSYENAKSGLVSRKAPTEVRPHTAFPDLADFLDAVTRFERATEERDYGKSALIFRSGICAGFQ
jgi:hypothetical protein